MKRHVTVKRAFSLIELLVVLGILGILMGILIGTFGGSSESARAAKCQSNMRSLAMAAIGYGTSNGVYPRATDIEYYPEAGKNKTSIMHGWLGDATDDPYEQGEDIRKKCFDNGAIWDYIKHNRNSYVCPGHQRHAKEKNKPLPLWSYAMNSYFDARKDTGKPAPSGDNLRRGMPLKRPDNKPRADRTLLFAELPYAQVKVGGEEVQSGNPSASELDPVLEYDQEVIGFNHKDGRNATGHVCFADGHVERLRAPRNKGNIQNLTRWLCRPWDVVKENNVYKYADFDISFNGTEYEQDTKEASKSEE